MTIGHLAVALIGALLGVMVAIRVFYKKDKNVSNNAK